MVTMEIPFTATQVLFYNDGSNEEKIITGTYRADDAAKITADIEETPLQTIIY